MNKNRKNKIIYSLLMLLCIVGFWLFENFYTPATYATTFNVEKITKIPMNLRPSSSTGVLVEHDHYMLSYSEDYEQAEWVAYLLDRSHITRDDRERPYFIEDPKVKTKSADWRNYRGSGYDRGHLCPAGDRRFSELAYNETFYTSNISPQQNDFNAGIWNQLEQQVRRWAKKEGPLVVVTAGVLAPGLPSIGEEEVAVPRCFYKIVSKGEGDHLKIIAFLFPNRKLVKDLINYVVTVDHLEELTGIDFFQGLPEKLQNKLESSINTNAWKL